MGGGRVSSTQIVPDEDRPLWKLSQDEMRILLITVVGGFASVLLGAAAIGFAVALARTEPKGDVLGVLSYLRTWFVVVGWASLATKKLRLIMRALWGRLFVPALAVLVVLTTIVSLGWLGLAAGLQQK